MLATWQYLNGSLPTCFSFSFNNSLLYCMIQMSNKYSESESEITNLFPDACKECVKAVGNVLFVVGFHISYHKYLVLFIMIW